MDTATVTVFISSKMVELAAERTALYDLLTSQSSDFLTLKAWAYEKDAEASNQTIREVYLDTLKNSRLYIGIFWNLYGEWTVDEYDRASEWFIDRHIYIKNVEPEKRDPQLTKFLEARFGVEKGPATVYFTTIEELIEKVRHSIRKWIYYSRFGHSPGSSNAVLATAPDDVPHQPRKLIGRDELLAQIAPALANGQRVLLKGFGGMGKTVLAATAAANFLKSNPGPVLWLEIGKETPDIIFEALARPLNASQLIAKEHGDAKIKTMKALLRQTEVKLLVLDNAWEGKHLKTVLDAVPRDMPVIVTSRHAYPLDVCVEVDELTPASALETLAYYAGNPPSLQTDPTAAALCQLLGYLAFSLEIAGKLLMVDSLSPVQLKTRIESAPHDIELPFDFAIEGHRRFADLIETSLDTLDDETRAVFLAFGAFFVPSATAELITLFFLTQSGIPRNALNIIQEQSPDLKEIPEDELNYAIHITYARQGAIKKLEEKLITLTRCSLIKRIDANDSTIYRIHDLTYSYLSSMARPIHHFNAAQACAAYVYAHEAQITGNFDALRHELDNLLNASTWAMQTKTYDLVRHIAYHLRSFIDYEGLYFQSIHLFELALLSSRIQDNIESQMIFLGILGVCYRHIGSYEKSITSHGEALKLAIQERDSINEARVLRELGISYRHLGQYENALDCLMKATTLRNRDSELAGNLSSIGMVFLDTGRYKEALDYLEQALSKFQNDRDISGESGVLGNIGLVHFKQGDARKALGFQQRALEINQTLSDKTIEIGCLGNLGLCYAALDEHLVAIDYYLKALAICDEIRDQRNKAGNLFHLAVSYLLTSDYEKAVEYASWAKDIFAEIGITHLTENVDLVIADAQAKLAGGAADPEPPPPAE